jgi:hypothetical protein
MEVHMVVLKEPANHRVELICKDGEIVNGFLHYAKGATQHAVTLMFGDQITPGFFESIELDRRMAQAETRSRGRPSAHRRNVAAALASHLALKRGCRSVSGAVLEMWAAHPTGMTTEAKVAEAIRAGRWALTCEEPPGWRFLRFEAANESERSVVCALGQPLLGVPDASIVRRVTECDPLALLRMASWVWIWLVGDNEAHRIRVTELAGEHGRFVHLPIPAIPKRKTQAQ